MAGRAVRGWGVFALGFAMGVLALVAGAMLYLRFGHPPVAAADPSFPMEAQIVNVPLHTRIEHEMRQPPFAADEASLTHGAAIYRRECASCHGTPGHDVASARWMFPRAPQLWKRHTRGNVVGVSDDEPGETYWKVANGIRLSGMPAYNRLLSETEMWQVTLLLKGADQPMSAAITGILQEEAARPEVK